MRVTVRLFARLREIAGAVGAARASCPTARPSRDAWEALAREFPALAEYERIALVRGQRRLRAASTTPLHDGDEVAFLPPVSGG